MERERTIDIFRKSPAPTLVLSANSPDYTILEANQAYESFSGLTKATLIGRPIMDTIVESPSFSNVDWRKQVGLSLEEVLKSSESHRMNIVKVDVRNSKDLQARERYCRAENTPVLDTHGEVEFILHMAFDVTDQVLREREQLLIFEQTEEAYVRVDSGLNIVSFNRRFVELTWNRFQRQVTCGEPVLDYVEPERLELVRSCYERVLKGERIEYSVRLPDGNGGARVYQIICKPAADAESVIDGVFVSLIDISEQTRDKEKYQESLERFRLATKATRDVIWDWDLSKNKVLWGENYKSMFGHLDEQTTDLSSGWINRIHPKDREATYESLLSAINDGHDIWDREYRFQKADGRYLTVEDHGYLIRNSGGRAIRMIGALRDVTAQRKLEFQLRERIRERECLYRISLLDDQTESVEGLLEKAVEQIPEGYQFPSLASSSIAWNGKIYRSKGFRKGPGRMSAESRGPEDSKLAIQVFYATEPNSKKSPDFLEEEYRLLETIRGLLSSKIEKILQNEQLVTSLKEKEILLAEIHHRVKNNLAVVAGLMELQAAGSDEPKLQEHLRKATLRIRSIADIHEHLYHAENFSQLDIAGNINSLASKIIDEFHQLRSVTYSVECEALELNINQAIPLTLIINEVLTNILKYAFDGIENGKIAIRVTDNNNKITLEIHDSGSPLPENFPRIDGNTLGHQLIDLLATQLNATYHYKSLSIGTVFTLRFSREQVKGIGSYFIR